MYKEKAVLDKKVYKSVRHESEPKRQSMERKHNLLSGKEKVPGAAFSKIGDTDMRAFIVTDFFC